MPRNYEEAGKWYDKAAKHKQLAVPRAITTVTTLTNVPVPEGFVLDQTPILDPFQPFVQEIPKPDPLGLGVKDFSRKHIHRTHKPHLGGSDSEQW